MWYIYYNWWTNIDNLLLTKVHSFELGITLYCTVLWLLRNSWCYIFTIQYHKELFPCPKNPFNSTYSSLLRSSLNPATTDLFTFSITLPFPECHMLGIVRYIVWLNRMLNRCSFSDWLLLFSNVHSGFLHVFSWLDSSFLFITEQQHSTVWMCQFVYPFISGRTSL